MAKGNKRMQSKTLFFCGTSKIWNVAKSTTTTTTGEAAAANSVSTITKKRAGWKWEL